MVYVFCVDIYVLGVYVYLIEQRGRQMAKRDETLSPKANIVLDALCRAAERSSDEWREVYLDNARPLGMSDKSFRSHLAHLSTAGLYKPIDGFAWGDVFCGDRS